MKFIDTIEIKNFKSIRHQKIEGCKRVNVFIGYPNVGKSNILEALSLFSIDKKNFDFSSIIRMDNEISLFFNGEISQNAEVILNHSNKCSIELGSPSFRFIYSYNSKNEADVVLDISEFELIPHRKKIHSYTMNKEFRDKEKLFKVKKYDFLRNIVLKSDSPQSLKDPFGNNIFDVISGNKKLREEINEIFDVYNLKLSYDLGTRNMRIDKIINNDVFSISYSMVADTIQRLIFYKAAILSNKESVLLFEEPEAHMFPPYISKLTGDIIYDENKNQFFIATHSPYVLNDFISDLDIEELALFIVTYDKVNGETIIHRMSDSEVHEAYQFGYDFFMNINQFIQPQEHE